MYSGCTWGLKIFEGPLQTPLLEFVMNTPRLGNARVDGLVGVGYLGVPR